MHIHVLSKILQEIKTDLQVCRFDPRFVHDLLNLFAVEIGKADRFNQA